MRFIYGGRGGGFGAGGVPETRTVVGGARVRGGENAGRVGADEANVILASTWPVCKFWRYTTYGLVPALQRRRLLNNPDAPPTSSRRTRPTAPARERRATPASHVGAVKVALAAG